MVACEWMPHVYVHGAGFLLQEQGEYVQLKQRQAAGEDVVFQREAYLCWWLSAKDQLEAIRQARKGSMDRVREQKNRAWEAQQRNTWRY